MSKKVIYISGKMGEKVLSEKTIAKFNAAQARLEKDGWEVVNPADGQFQREAERVVTMEEARWRNENIEGEFDWYSYILLFDLHIVAQCDAIYMLSDWRDSPGATSEHAYALACHKEIIYESNV
jgi:nucleoside 2-deoxyribosyltransferase